MTIRALSLMLVLGVTASLGTPIASATTDAARASAPSPLPPKKVVKKSLGGAGAWSSYRADVTAVGSKPTGCRSDLQMLTPSSVRARSYHGQVAGLAPTITTGAQIAVFSYPTVADARAAVRRNASYPKRCPRVTEWVCEDCDGVWTTRRTKVRAPRVGVQRTAWRFKEVGNLKSNGFTIIARRGTTVVRVVASRTGDYTDPRMSPPWMSKKSVAQLTRRALRAAS